MISATYDYVELGPVPSDEEAAAFGVDPDFDRKNFSECQRFYILLVRTFLGTVPDGVHIRFIIKKFPYEGSYYREVCVEYDSEDRRSVDLAYSIEQSLPTAWE